MEVFQCVNSSLVLKLNCCIVVLVIVRKCGNLLL